MPGDEKVRRAGPGSRTIGRSTSAGGVRADGTGTAVARRAGRRPRWRRWAEPAFLIVTLASFLAGLAARLAGAPDVADACWAVGTVVAVLPTAAWVVVALRRGRAGVDLLAVVSLLGTLTVGEYLAR